MAQLLPPAEVVRQLTVPPTEGEAYLLSALHQHLDESFEVYFQPFLNGDNPDIIVVRRGHGVLIIEVKDWRLAAYRLARGKSWTLARNGSQVKSPLVQVFDYKRNLYELHIDSLQEKKIADPAVFDLVGCMIYFHNEDEGGVRSFLGGGAFTPEDQLRGFGNMQVAGRDSVAAAGVRTWIERGGLDTPNPDFDDALYASFRRYLQPPLHTLEQGVPLTYPGKQAELVVSRPGQQKVRGVAGSGKTMVLARRAVNALKRISSRVLILTYNITLCNYIHDKFSQVRENFRWDDFFIIHYHEFFKSMANNLGLPITGLGDFDREDFFEAAADRTPRFAALFIDEVQDYKVEWLRSLRKYFLLEGGEFVLFGDEKQNIYSRALEVDRRIRTNIPGRWNELTASFRLSDHVVKLATAYQRHFFEGRYELDAIEAAPEQRGLFDLPQHFRYSNLSGERDCVEAVYQLYSSVASEYSIHPNDVCIVSSRTALLREVDYLIRTRKREKTKTMFESKEVFDQLCRQIEHHDERDEAVQAVRKARKFHFWMNPGTVKLATVHSFKGWEINTLILVVHGAEAASGSEGNPGGRDRISDEELVYTAITRCRHNLFVANLGDRKYDDFFSRVKAQG
jgi:hypothetical protein